MVVDFVVEGQMWQSVAINDALLQDPSFKRAFETEIAHATARVLTEGRKRGWLTDDVDLVVDVDGLTEQVMLSALNADQPAWTHRFVALTRRARKERR